MKIEATLGNPTTPGLYCARQWYGYRILEWDGEKWWHEGRNAEWPKNAEIEAHIGPLPTIVKDYGNPPTYRGRDNRQPQTIVRVEEDWEKEFRTGPGGPEYDL